MKLAIAFVALLVLGGCGHKTVLWHPPDGMTGREYNRDRLVCRGVSDYPARTVPGGGLGGALMNAGVAQEAQAAYIQCMTDAGYRPEYR